MSTLTDKLRSSSPLVASLRGQPVFRRVPVFQEQEDPVKTEIKKLKESGVPLPKILKGIDGLGAENPDGLKRFAENLYNVFNQADFRGEQKIGRAHV